MKIRCKNEYAESIRNADLILPISKSILSGAKFLNKTVPFRYNPFDAFISILSILESRYKSFYIFGGRKKPLLLRKKICVLLSADFRLWEDALAIIRSRTKKILFRRFQKRLRLWFLWAKELKRKISGVIQIKKNFLLEFFCITGTQLESWAKELSVSIQKFLKKAMKFGAKLSEIRLDFFWFFHFCGI